MIIGSSPDEDRGRKDVSMVNESRTAWALDVSERRISDDSKQRRTCVPLLGTFLCGAG
jgi:hypothetical protein